MVRLRRSWATGWPSSAQALAANPDLVLAVGALAGPARLRRVEPYLAVAWSSGATPVVVLTKADLCDDVAAAVELVAGDAPGVDVLAVSAYTGGGRGRHATTAGRMHALPGGGLLVDNPGMREPGCAVAEAIDDGRLDPARSVAWRTRRT